MPLVASLKLLGRGHTRSCYLPQQELRLVDWIPGFTFPEPNVGHWSLMIPPKTTLSSTSLLL
jgi:hypothetical protein